MLTCLEVAAPCTHLHGQYALNPGPYPKAAHPEPASPCPSAMRSIPHTHTYSSLPLPHEEHAPHLFLLTPPHPLPPSPPPSSLQR